MTLEQLSPVQFFRAELARIKEDEQRFGKASRRAAVKIPHTTLETGELAIPTVCDELILRASMDQRTIVLQYPFGFPINVRRQLGVVNAWSVTVDEIKMLIEHGARLVQEYSCTSHVKSC
jgi:hypothetical protein